MNKSKKIIDFFNKIKIDHKKMVRSSELVMDHAMLEDKLKDLRFNYESGTFYIDVILNIDDMENVYCPSQECRSIISDFLNLDLGMYVNYFILPYVEKFYLDVIPANLFDFTKITINVFDSKDNLLVTY